MLRMINKVLIYLKKNRQLVELELDDKFFHSYAPFVEAIEEDAEEMRKRLGKLNDKQQKAGRLLENDAREKMELERKINFQNSIAEKRMQVKKFQDEVRAYIKSIW